MHGKLCIKSLLFEKLKKINIKRLEKLYRKHAILKSWIDDYLNI